jgi:hypothetical protein
MIPALHTCSNEASAEAFEVWGNVYTLLASEYIHVRPVLTRLSQKQNPWYHTSCEWSLCVLLRILLALHWVVDCVSIMRISFLIM